MDEPRTVESEVLAPLNETPEQKKAAGPGGRPNHLPCEVTRKTVESMAAVGITQADIAKVVGVSEVTLRKHYREELDNAAIKANAQVGTWLFGACKEGNVTAQIFWAKTRMGWKETNVNQLQNLDENGNPVAPPVDVTPDLVQKLIEQVRGSC